jgi:4-hydroxybenzoate polyprenyltransferase
MPYSLGGRKMTLSRILIISRPVSWLGLPLVFLGGVSSAHAHMVDLRVILEAVVLTIPFGVIAYGINDIHDQRSDELNPRKGTLDGARLKPPEVRTLGFVIIAMALLSILVATTTANVPNVVAMFVLLFLTLGYSMPPIRFKEKPPFDSLASGGICLATFFLGSSFGTLSQTMIFKAVLLSVAVTAIHMFSTLMDMTPDARAGQRTFALKYGGRLTGALAGILVLSVMIIGRYSPPVTVYLSLAGITMGVTSSQPIKRLERAARMGMILLLAAFYPCSIWLLAGLK